MLEMIFETHSISLDNERGIATGWNDGALSKVGKRLALELGARHRAQLPAAVFISDLGRAVETAEIAFGTRDVPFFQDERLRECDYGELTGMPVELLEAERARYITTPYPVARATSRSSRPFGASWRTSENGGTGPGSWSSATRPRGGPSTA